MTLFDRVQQTLATTLKVPTNRIGASTVDEDVPSWDSLGHVNIVMALEQTFGIMIEVEDFEHLNSVPAILDYLGRQGVAEGP
jgi:acyl carrier protein